MMEIHGTGNRSDTAETGKSPVVRIGSTGYLTVLLASAILLLVGSGLFLLYRDGRYQGLQDRLLAIQELHGDLVYYDEVLTMSARMAASTGDPAWEERYLVFEKRLTEALQTARALSPGAFPGNIADEVGKANAALVAMEKRAFLLIRRGNRIEADALLGSSAYRSPKDAYMKGVDAINDQMKELAVGNLVLFKRSTVVVAFIGAAVTFLLLITMLGGTRVLRRHIAGIRHVKDELQTANENLEARIAERTIELEKVNGRVNAELAQRRLSEIESEQLRKRMEFILGATKTGLDIIDADFNVRYIDPEWQKVYGDPKGRKCHEYFLGEKEPCPGCGLPTALWTKTITVTEESLRKEGNRPIQVTSIPFVDENGEWLVAEVNVDVTERKMAEEKLVRAERMAALGTLTSGIAHQFNNIHAIALGYLNALEKEPDLSASAKECVVAMRGAIERAVAITYRLLLLSSPAAAEPVPIMAGDLVRAALPSLLPDVQKGDVKLLVDLKDTRPVRVEGMFLEFIVCALVVNGLHALLERPIRELRVETGDEGTGTRIRVIDTGIGISPGKQSCLFTPFFSEKGENAPPGSPLAKVKGVGLSLAVAHSIVTSRGGKIEASSKEGVGSAFTVWLPSHCGEDGGIRLGSADHA